MIPHPLSADNTSIVLQIVELVTQHPVRSNGSDNMITQTRETIAQVLRDFLDTRKNSFDRISVIDGFLFIFNDMEFTKWHTLNWWEQRRRIQTLKNHNPYNERAYFLLHHSDHSPYMDYTDDMVARSDKPEVKHAWMRKRLVMKECYWNAIDSISHAAYFKRKYRDQFPGLCVLLCNVDYENGGKNQLVLGIDNGTGSLYKKKSRHSSLIRFLYIMYKLFFKKGVFYIGGLELGLQETDSELSLQGAGAVVYQGW